MNKGYDVIIIGAGPAGLSAGIYTARGKLHSVIIEKTLVGGQIATAELVENYPGFVSGISGLELTQLMHQQATKYGLQTLMAEVTGIEAQDSGEKVVTTSEGSLTARVVIIAGGTIRRKLDVPGEAEFTGKGVSYCATCDGPFFRDRVVAVIGGGNVAISEAIFLTRFAEKVVVVHRRDQLRAGRLLQEKALSQPKIEFAWNSVVERITGNDFVSELRLRQARTGVIRQIPIAGVFISIGLKADTDYLKSLLALDEAGNIITNQKMETKVRGIYACGDIRSNAARQTICACGDGATAAIYAERFLLESATSR
jgi:thioredoxin reductase (NADPH)